MVEEDLKNRLSIKAPEPNDKASDEDFVEQIIPTCAVGDILDLHSVSSEDKYTKATSEIYRQFFIVGHGKCR